MNTATQFPLFDQNECADYQPLSEPVREKVRVFIRSNSIKPSSTIKNIQVMKLNKQRIEQWGVNSKIEVLDYIYNKYTPNIQINNLIINVYK